MLSLSPLRDDLVRFFARRAPDEAEDLAQEALLRIHRGLSSVRDTERVDAWVRSVAYNVWRDRLRARRPETEELEDPAAPAEEGPGATGTVAAWLPDFVEALPEPYREAVRLADLEGVSQQEIARRLGISASGARTRVQRGRARLRAELEACCAIGWSEGEVVDIQRHCGC